jgi:uncharacterized protein YjlB
MVDAEVFAHLLKDDGTIPNSDLPLLIYRGAVEVGNEDAASTLEKLFRKHKWHGTWRNGIYSYHHYHSTAHEVLGVYAGEAKVQFGGEEGVVDTVQAGDVVVIPAGVGHKNLGASSHFGVVGAYPEGQDYDMCYGNPEERPQAIRNIARVAKPKLDPVFGKDGPLLDHWK